MKTRAAHLVALAAWVASLAALGGACGGSSAANLGSGDASTGSSSGASGSGSGGTSGSGSSSGSSSSSGASGSSSGTNEGGSGSGGSSGGSSGSSSGGPGDGGTPQTCADAAGAHTYFGCDFWPTVTANSVWSIFDYAVVVTNNSGSTANVTVTGPSGVNVMATVAPGGLAKIYLPWVPLLKGSDSDSCGSLVPLTGSVLARTAAYHLVSTVPVAVFQFNALEYTGAGGAPGKSWSSCPGMQACLTSGSPIGCYSFTNDASLLLPSTSMTGTYRVTGHEGWTTGNEGAYVVITATADGTHVAFDVSSTGQILAGGGIAATPAGGTLALTLDAGDVAELLGGGTDASDLSGSLVKADKPVQVITGMSCLDVPDSAPACDHVEESNWPAETLSNDYVVAQPAGPHGAVVGQLVRIYGNFDATALTYLPSTPPGCPSVVNAGQVAECGVVAQDFEVQGSNAFGVGLFTQGASVVDPGGIAPNQEGDPDQSLAIPVAQFRKHYVFLAPDDYQESYAVIVVPNGATMTLDGTPLTMAPVPVASTGFGVVRAPLSSALGGAHVLDATAPVGVQVMGYGSYTSYQFPAGLDLGLLSPAPSK